MQEKLANTHEYYNDSLFLSLMSIYDNNNGETDNDDDDNDDEVDNDSDGETNDFLH